jgi:hypothetical protein
MSETPGKPDPPITFDDESDSAESVNVTILAVDSLAAATAIAFTVLLLKDLAPFLN